MSTLHKSIASKVSARALRLMHFSPQGVEEPSIMGVAWMSFFWSASSLMVFSLLPAFMVDELHASNTSIGMIEGVAWFSAFAAKVYAGVMSDYWRVRKPLIFAGTIGSVFVKPLFALAISMNWIIFARLIDRLSKGVRSSPTQALLADFAPKEKQGVSFGIRQTLYTSGAVVGSFTATALMIFTQNNYRLIFLLSMIPAAIALFILWSVIREPKVDWKDKSRSHRWRLSDMKALPPSYWRLLGITAILMLARFSEAFVALRAKDLGWSVALLPLLIVSYDILHAGVAYPIGRLADRMDRQKLLLIGILVLLLTNIVLIGASSLWMAFLGAMLAGLHMGMTQGLLSTLVAESTPSHLRGTAFAVFYMVCGIAVLIGNTVAGFLSDIIGLAGAFCGGAVFTIFASLALYWMIRKGRRLSYSHQRGMQKAA